MQQRQQKIPMTDQMRKAMNDLGAEDDRLAVICCCF
jgi:hypothetical protein